MPELTADQKFMILAKGQEDLASAMRDIAMHVFKHDPMAENGEYTPDMPEDLDMMGNHGMNRQEPPMDPMLGGGDPAAGGGMPGMGDPMLEEPLPGEEDMELGMHYQSAEDDDEDDEDEINMSSPMAKGYANTAQHTTDEEDAPFGEQQSNIKGNEPSPAGEMGGGREDETFNAAFSGTAFAGYMNEIRALRKDLQSGNRINKSRGQRRQQGPVVGAVVPGLGNINKGRDGQVVMTAELEKAAKERSWKELNQLREVVGDLPRNAFVR